MPRKIDPALQRRGGCIVHQHQIPSGQRKRLRLQGAEGFLEELASWIMGADDDERSTHDPVMDSGSADEKCSTETWGSRRQPPKRRSLSQSSRPGRTSQRAKPSTMSKYTRPKPSAAEQ